MICTELRNPTSVTQTVHVEFGVVNFGIGLPFTPIDLQQVQIPPFGKIKVCTHWVPAHRRTFLHADHYPAAALPACDQPAQHGCGRVSADLASPIPILSR